MRKLSKSEKNEVAEFARLLQEEADKIDTKAALVSDGIAGLNDSIQAYNNVLKNVRDFRDGIVQKMTDFAEEQPDNWQEKNGETYQDWVASWEEVELADLDLIGDLDIDEAAHPGALLSLPEESSVE